MMMDLQRILMRCFVSPSFFSLVTDTRATMLRVSKDGFEAHGKFHLRNNYRLH